MAAPLANVPTGVQPVALTSREFAVLEYLALHRGRLVTRTSLSNTMDVLIYNKRTKLDRDLITTQRQYGHVLLIVADNFPGIPEEHLRHLFDRFYRAEASRTRSTGHNGLGLAISKAIVDAHGGTLEAANGSNGGAVFTVRVSADC